MQITFKMCYEQRQVGKFFTRTNAHNYTKLPAVTELYNRAHEPTNVVL